MNLTKPTHFPFSDTSSVSISARSKPLWVPLKSWITSKYGIKLKFVESIFGFTEKPYMMYGGRIFRGGDITSQDVKWMKENDIGYRIPLTNIKTSDKAYEEVCELLDEHHSKKNSIIAVNDDFVKRVRNDFPLYKIEASAIKDIITLEEISKTLELYDEIVLPASQSNNYSFLDKIEEKERIRLFINSTCEHSCPAKICYPTISQSHINGDWKEHEKKWEGVQRCSKTRIERESGYAFYDVPKLEELGFSKFKIVPYTYDEITNIPVSII